MKDMKLNQNKKDQKLIHDCNECVYTILYFMSGKMNFGLKNCKNKKNNLNYYN